MKARTMQSKSLGSRWRFVAKRRPILNSVTPLITMTCRGLRLYLRRLIRLAHIQRGEQAFPTGFFQRDRG